MLEANVKEDKKAGNENFSLYELGRKDITTPISKKKHHYSCMCSIPAHQWCSPLAENSLNICILIFF